MAKKKTETKQQVKQYKSSKEYYDELIGGAKRISDETLTVTRINELNHNVQLMLKSLKELDAMFTEDLDAKPCTGVAARIKAYQKVVHKCIKAYRKMV